MLDAVARFVDAGKIRPVVDPIFAFGEARQAYTYLDNGQHFGKVIIEARN